MDSVLIVEDDPALVRAIERNLSIRGVTSQRAGTVAEALNLLALHRPVLVLLDVDLPDGSGWEVVRTLRADDGTDIPVILISALRPNPRLAREYRCTAVLEKPFPMDTLNRQITVHLPTESMSGGEARSRGETA